MKVVVLMFDVIVDGKNVIVFVDYDVDGGISLVIFVCYFWVWGQEIGLYVLDCLIEGYGLSLDVFCYLKV